MDLDAYIGRYSGETRLQRLLLIARTTPDDDLANQAFGLAEQQIKADGNVRRYKEVFGYHHQQLQQQQESEQDSSHQQQQQRQDGARQQQPPSHRHPNTPFDVEWVQMTEASNKSARYALQGRLSAAQSHLHKEAIRTAYVALAQHDTKTGELRDAMGYLLRATDYCTTRSQTAHISLKVLELALALENFPQVREYVTKVEHTLGSSTTGAASSSSMGMASPSSMGSPTASSPGGAGGSAVATSSQAIATKLKIASGLERLAQGNYESAAQILTTLITTTSSTSWEWQSVICPEDIALYAAILSLATQDRSRICELADHPDALELVPLMRELLVQFTRAKYHTCCTCFTNTVTSSSGTKTAAETSQESSIATSTPILPFRDLYLDKHWSTLCTMIREKCLMEYLKPYQCVQLDVMAQQFPMENLQDVLVDLIGRGLVPHARVDARKRILVKSNSAGMSKSGVPQNTLLCRKLAKMEQRVLDDTYAMLVRLACLEHDIIIQDNTANASGAMGASRGRRERGGGGGGGRFPEDDRGLGAGIDDSSSDDEGDTPMLDVSGGELYANPEDLY